MQVRRLERRDIPEACVLLNRIIALGGTTAHEMPFDDAGLAAYLMGPETLCCHVVLDDAGRVAGFQHLEPHAGLPEGCGDIATFTRRDDPVKGAGRALMAATVARARALGLREINATIRADNGPGLGYYRGMGFVERSATRGVPLADGRPVDRLHHRLALGETSG
ncbi:MAG: GNAT family N-acetyltransferase [Pseudooceanicola sp.]|nr:GNAT family N-acetyltransferase [Pseudooceanicola sp.]